MSARRLVAAAALALAGCAPGAPGLHSPGPGALYDPGPLDDPVLGRCAWSGRVTGRFVYQEQHLIRAYFEAADPAAYRRAIPPAFAVPERPLVRVTVLDFYAMASGPTYRESEVSVLALHEGEPGWVVLTMPVTDGDSCGGGRSTWGYPKVVRRVTLEGGPDRYVGVSYAPGGRAPELTLTLELAGAAPGEDAREVLRFVSPFPSLTLRAGRVMRFGGDRRPAWELERAAPDVYRVRLGHARLEVSREPDTLLRRLGVGRPLAAYWARVRARYSITPR
ncbi:MAG TPA: hypothetical protein DDZ42_13030 [Candidatus Rokubacteria bacterium]|nr:MAG: hypothetical protein A2050_07485 [Candidatus Rokubacteria bacterium GWA2_73_35]HBH02822.1 hypothetical protein [Candidatus Rokubacteria bacterium]